MGLVLEGLLGINDTWYKRRFGEITDFNEANNTGYMFVDRSYEKGLRY